MSSSVFFKFKSQKEPSRVAFDGTGISVFELKREIITINKLGDGTDFDLAIYNQDTNEEYDEDTTIIPRSTSIIAKRLPPAKAGRGSAHRYVSGKMPTAAHTGRDKTKHGFSRKDESSIPGMPAATGHSEEDRIAAMFQASSDNWSKTQEQMAAATPIHRGPPPGGFKKGAAAPSHPPPHGYICYRCGEKGHWIQACPTNTNPEYDGRRVKRTTGIPRSFLKAVDKPPPVSSDDEKDKATTVMLTTEGEYVVAEPDKASWESYQQKAAKSTAQASEDSVESKELQEKGLDCPICHKLFKDASKTPCCSKVYCEDCIQSALLESDFVCPACESKDIYLDHLKPDDDMRKKVEDYKQEKGLREKSKSPPTATAQPIAQASKSLQKPATQNATAATVQPTSNSKKRPAEDEISPEKPRGPSNIGSENKTTPANQVASPNKLPAMPITSISSSNNNNNDSNGNYGANGNFNNNNGNNFPQNIQGMNFFPGFNGMVDMNQANAMMANGMGGGDMSQMGMGNMAMGMNGMGGNMGMMNGNMTNGYGNNHNHYNNNNNNNNNAMGMNMGGMNMNMNMNMANGNMAMMNNGGHVGNMGNSYNNQRNNGYNSYNNGNQYNNHQNKFNGMQNNMGNGNGNSNNNNNHNINPVNAINTNNNQFNGFGRFPNQQRTVFSEPFPSEEDSPYMRKPVNPHRHMKQKRVRPSDFKALGE